MFKRILVPLDGTARADDAARTAQQLAEHTGGSLELVYVETEAGASDETLEAQMSRQLRKMTERGVQARAHKETGQPSERIVAASGDLGADLIVLAPHHRGALSRVLPAGITEQLLEQSRVPLLVCPAREHITASHQREMLSSAAGMVICPLDGSAVAARALPVAIAIAQQFERTLVLARVVEPIQGFGTGPSTHQILREAQREHELEAMRYLHDVRRHLARNGVTAQSMLLLGDPAEEILGLSAAHETSIVVMSTHGRGGLSRVVVGSVTAEVFKRSTVPIVVVPPLYVPEEAAADATQRTAAHAMAEGHH